MTDRNERRAFLGDRQTYEFPDCCVVCLGPTAEHRRLRSTQPVRHLLHSETSPTLQTYEYEDVVHSLYLDGVPYCAAHSPHGDDEPKLESHGLRVSARRKCTNQNIRAEAHIEVDRIVLEFANADYAARFRAVNDAPTPAAHRQQQREAASELAKEVTKALPKLLSRETWAKARLSMSADRHSPEPLIRALSDSRAGVRLSALQKLNFILKDERALAAAREARATIAGLAHDEETRVRRLAVDVVKRMGVDADSLPVFIDAMDDEDHFVRVSAVWGLSECPQTSATENLIVMLDDDDELVREAAIAVLGGRGVAPEVIAPALDDESERVRSAARRALDQLAASR